MNSFKEKLFKIIFCVFAYFSLIFLLGIIITLFSGSFQSITTINQFHFLFSTDWAPYYDPPEFGILSLVVSSLVVGITACLICMPIAVGTGLFLFELATPKMRAVLKPLIEILAGIPSIIFGFFAMVVLAPWLQKTFDLPSGLCAFTASLTLAFMAIPQVVSITEDALSFVPKSFKEASYALGANRWQTLIKVITPAAGSGISTAIILGASRIIGETMIVLMVAGGATAIPRSLFMPVRPMTSTIAAEMGEAAVGGLHFSALFEIGLLLFIFTFFLNFLADRISKKYRLKLGHGR
jgi:phosphate transport system permease protein